MRIALRGSCSPNCRGLDSYLEEYSTMHDLYFKVLILLTVAKHYVINCNSTKNTKNKDLRFGVQRANNSNCSFFLSIHLNHKNGQAHGVEAWVSDANSEVKPYAKRLVRNLSLLGFKDRGVKYDKKLYEINHSSIPTIVLNVCYGDNQKDAEIFERVGYDRVARCIANALDPNVELYKIKEEGQ